MKLYFTKNSQLYEAFAVAYTIKLYKSQNNKKLSQ